MSLLLFTSTIMMLSNNKRLSTNITTTCISNLLPQWPLSLALSFSLYFLSITFSSQISLYTFSDKIFFNFFQIHKAIVVAQVWRWIVVHVSVFLPKCFVLLTLLFLRVVSSLSSSLYVLAWKLSSMKNYAHVNLVYLALNYDLSKALNWCLFHDLLNCF